jgi:ADP-ribose pyrophosphatase
MQIRGVTRLTDEKWLNLFAATFEHNKHEGRWVFASRQAKPYQTPVVADAVIVVPVLITKGQPRRLAVIREFRIPVGDYVYGLPAGLVDPGETIETCVRRELLEETGLKVKKILRVTQPLYSSSGLTDETAAMVFVEASQTKKSKAALEAAEEIEMILLDFEGICRLCDDTSARMDAKLWTVLFLCQQLGHIL